MPSVTKSNAIVLHLTRQGDSGAVLHVIDSVGGRKGIYVRGLGKGRGTSVSAFHNLAVLDIVTYATPKSSLLYLREYTPVFSLDNIRTDIRKGTIALFISEVLYRSLKSDDGDTDLWKWLAEMIVALDSLQGSAANFHLWWLAGYSIKTGFRPKDNWSAERQIFDIVSAQFIPAGAGMPESGSSAVKLPRSKGQAANSGRGSGESSGGNSAGGLLSSLGGGSGGDSAGGLLSSLGGSAGGNSAGGLLGSLGGSAGGNSAGGLLSSLGGGAGGNSAGGLLSSLGGSAGGRWDAEDRRFMDDRQLFSAEDSRLLHAMLNSTLEEALAMPLSSSRRLSFARRMLDYLSFRFGCDLNVKSLDVLHEIFQ